MTEQYWQRYKQVNSMELSHTQDQFWTNVRTDLRRRERPKHNLELYSMCKSENPYIRQIKASPNITPGTVAELICRDKACELQYCLSMQRIADQNRHRKIDIKGCRDQYSTMRGCLNEELTRVMRKEDQLRRVVFGLPEAVQQAQRTTPVVKEELVEYI